MTTPHKSAFSRVFLAEGGSHPDVAPAYKPDLRAMAWNRGYGDSERIEVPDPSKLGEFIEVGETRGTVERPTTGLQGRYPAKDLSDLARIAKIGCELTLQVLIGSCNSPYSYEDYDKVIVFENARFTNYSTDELGALQSSDNAAVNESSDVTAKDVYEVVPVSYGVKAAAQVTNEVLAVTSCDSVACGDCGSQSDGCKKFFAITKGAGGSPSTPPDIVYTLDKGATWYVHDIESLLTAEDPDDIACLGRYLVVVSSASESLHYALLSEMDGLTDPAWTEVATGFVSGKGPKAIWSVGSMAFIVGIGGYIYKLIDAPSGVSILDAGSATIAQLNDVHALSEDFAIAVGNAGVIVYTSNQTTWALASTSPVGYGVNLNCVWAKSDQEWWVGAANGKLYYTRNAGKSWTEKTFAGSGAGVVYDIVFPTNSVGFMSHSTATPKARIFRTTNGGYTWKATPEKGAAFPLADRVDALAYCPNEPNLVVGVGLADDAADGFIAVGIGS